MQQRHCLILQGQDDWLETQANAVYQQQSLSARLWLSDLPQRPAGAVKTKQAQQQLGREFSFIVFDARQAFAADAFGAVIGALKAGGAIMILLPVQSQSFWLSRFIRLAGLAEQVQRIQQDGPGLELALPKVSSKPQPVPNEEQQQAIQAVLRVVSGHRRRPLVISSDRGRGKTALLGMAAAELLKQGKTRILITAPASANIETLLLHAELQLEQAERNQTQLRWRQGQICFIAPDALLTEKPEADLLLIDEAAAIPAQLLEQMLRQYSRIVFATTLHGYEGTGRGFALRFRKTLDKLTPDWRAVTLTRPIRWRSDDALEQFSFDALLLNAEPADDADVVDADCHNVEFELVEQASLAADEKLLREVFGLMVLAHYRTRPSDLQMLLDRDDISVAVLRYRSRVVASAWLVDEGPLADELAQKVFDGERRLKGQLLPQSLLVHAGLPDAGRYHYQRIIRIATHPAAQQRGLASLLLKKIAENAHEQDLLGTSFAMDEAVLRFWLANKYHPVRIGQHRDQVTGSVSLMMLAAVSQQGQRLLATAQQQIRWQWPQLLSRQLDFLAPELVSLLAQRFDHGTPVSGRIQWQQLKSFAYAQHPLESTEVVLWRWLSAVMGSPTFMQLERSLQAVLIMVIMQQRDIGMVAESLGLSGRAEVIRRLRQAVSECLTAASSETR